MPFAACPLMRIVAMVDRVAGAERRCACNKKMAALPMRRPTEEATMLTMSHAAGANEPAVRDITLGELLQWAAETTPDRVALIAGVPDKANRRQWTYAELYTQSVRTARALRARFEPGERAAIRCWRRRRRWPPAARNCARSWPSSIGMHFWNPATSPSPSFRKCDRPI